MCMICIEFNAGRMEPNEVIRAVREEAQITSEMRQNGKIKGSHQDFLKYLDHLDELEDKALRQAEADARII